MLHILLLILKIIGIVLAAILGLLVLLLCILFFIPLRYRAEALTDGGIKNISAKLRFHWFLHLLSGEVIYEKGKLLWKMRIFWKRMSDEDEESEEKSKVVAEETVKDATSGETQKKETIASKSSPEEKSKAVPEADEKYEETRTENKKEKKSVLKKIYEKLISLYKKIKYTIKKIYGNIKVLLERKEKCIEFLTDEVHRSAFAKTKKEVFRLIKSLKPKKLKYRIHFGCEDPYVTGQILAYLSMIYPFIGDNGTITPEFDEEILEGDLMIKGHIRIIHFIRILWNLLLDKQVRVTVKHIKNFKF